MSRYLICLVAFLSAFCALGQEGFQLPEGVDKITIPFKRSNNLIIIPVKVNGTPLNFILDTGASHSIIFNLEKVDSLNVQKGNKLKISGYGKRDPFEVYYSSKNQLECNGYYSNNANLFIMANNNINLSGFLGVNIHGLMGYDFLSNFLVELDYQKSVVNIHGKNSKIKRRLRRSTKTPIKIEKRKPYAITVIENNDGRANLNTLIDTGNGDAMWMLPPLEKSIIPKKGFPDFLGTGLSGKVKGMRSKVDQLSLGKHQLNGVTVSLPEVESLANYSTDTNQQLNFKGSVGGEVLSRFKVFLDYQNEMMYLKPRENLKKGFYYNMAGIELIEGDLQVFSTIEDVKLKEINDGYRNVSNDGSNLISKRKVITLAPRIFINYVRPDSPAAIAGLKVGDEILKFNNTSQANLRIDKLSSKFYSKPYSNIKFSVKRDVEIFKVKFQLIPLI